MRDLANRPDLCCINTATLGFRISVEAAIDGLAARGIGGVSPWRRDLEGRRAAEVARRAADAGVRIDGYCRSSYLTHADPARRRAAHAENLRALDDAAELGAACYVLVVGGLAPGERDLGAARARARDGVADLLDAARARGVALALEPLHPVTTAGRSCLNTLAEALDWCDELDADGGNRLGVIVDAYHVWWDAALAAQIARACRARRVLGFHVSDWIDPPPDPVRGRGMMGDGAIDLRGIRRELEQGGFEGAVEVEIMSDAWDRRPVGEVLDACVRRVATVC